jgi:hypothetical protein
MWLLNWSRDLQEDNQLFMTHLPGACEFESQRRRMCGHVGSIADRAFPSRARHSDAVVLRAVPFRAQVMSGLSFG